MVWQQDHPEFPRYPGYAGFLADLLARIDPPFRRFVYDGIAHEIRVEEIAWGGAVVDGIPALDNPATKTVPAASYLNPLETRHNPGSAETPDALAATASSRTNAIRHERPSATPAARRAHPRIRATIAIAE